MRPRLIGIGATPGIRRQPQGRTHDIIISGAQNMPNQHLRGMAKSHIDWPRQAPRPIWQRQKRRLPRGQGGDQLRFRDRKAQIFAERCGKMENHTVANQQIGTLCRSKALGRPTGGHCFQPSPRRLGNSKR